MDERDEQGLQDAALALLSVRIGMIMEDHAGEAILSLPKSRTKRLKRFEILRLAGSDIAAMAAAAEAFLRQTQEK